jgi:hypothetical protein
MTQEMRLMETNSPELIAKSGRWIGWIYRVAEEQSILTHETVRMLSEKDVREGFDLSPKGRG